jgi:hypothetical protein
MAEKVFLSKQRVSFNTPLFTENFKHDIFCEKLSKALENPVQITNKEGEVITSCAPKGANLRISVMQLFQTSENIGVIIFISSPVANGSYFYIQGETHITLMIDPCVENVEKTISGYSILLNDK